MHYLGQLPDLPLPHTGGKRLRTRRKPLGQIVLCQGCCCGQTSRGLPAVPLDWLKPLWKAEKLNKVVQLTVSGCLGPCDLPNVCCIATPQEQVWYGRLTTPEDYRVLLNWARRCRDQGELLPPPVELEHLRFERWPGNEKAEPFTPIKQDPADIVLLTAADSEMMTWSAAVARLPDGFPSLRALNLDRLRDPQVFDAYLDDVLQESRVVLMRVLGGLGYWREPLEQIRLLALAHGIHLICLPGDAQPDLPLAAFGTVPLQVADRALRYCIQGDIHNAAAMMRYLSDTLLSTAFGYEPPLELAECGIYHPDHSGVLDLETWRKLYEEPDRPTAGIVFYRSHWVTGNLTPVNALVRALEGVGLNAPAVFGPNLPAVLQSSLLPKDLDVLLTTTSFSACPPDQGRMEPYEERPGGAAKGETRGSRFGLGGFGELDVPVLQCIFCSSSENAWAANIAGLSPRDIAMNVALPEFDGRLISTAVSFKNTFVHDSALQTEIIRYEPRLDRVTYVAQQACNWACLRHTANAQKKVAIVLANYPSKNARVGNAVGLDTPASLHRLLLALDAAGYNTGAALPADGQALIHALIAASLQDTEFATESAYDSSVGWVAKGQYDAWLSDCPAVTRDKIVHRWGGPEGSPQFHRGGFPIPGLLFGNIFVGIQPARGYDQDPAAAYHSPDLPPPPYYLAFYRWICEAFGAHAVIHLGKHGNLEWLPGKGSALSAACFPEVVLQDLPNIYSYIINDPGEGTQAKRRSAAAIVDHLIPPMTSADTYGELRELENLLDEFYAVQSLDPTKPALILERITEVVEKARLDRDLDGDPPLTEAQSTDQVLGWLNRLGSYLCELKEAQIRDGLHVLGQLPEGEQLIDLLWSLVRVDNGPVPGLTKALAQDLGLDYGALTKDLAAPAPHSIRDLQLPPSPCCTCGDVVEALHLLGRKLIQECRRTESSEAAVASVIQNCQLPIANCQLDMEKTLACLRFLCTVVWPRLQLCHQEIDHILAALAGRFVPPGPSGAPTRGTADVLPTGRNFYSVDVRTIPTQTAWRVGCAAGQALLERHRELTGAYPESVAMVVWGTSNMRTHGDDIAEILYLLGVRPCWDETNRRVIGIEAIPLVELGRPRIDVTVRISGLFRDAFPNLVRLLNEAVTLVARLEEPLDRNYVRAHMARDTALLLREGKERLREGGKERRGEGEKEEVGNNTRSDSAGLSFSSSVCLSISETLPLSTEEAARRAGLRVFGSKPGAYGAGLLPLMDGCNWQTTADLAEVYLAWSSYAYTGAVEPGCEDGREECEAFQLRLADTVVVAQNQDNREHDIFDSDDYFQFHGGLIAAVHTLTGKAPAAYIGDTSRPDDVRARTLREETYRVFRSRVINPRWLAGVMRHGYKGAVEMTATVDYLFGYDATAKVMEDWMYERLAAAYLLDDAVAEFLRHANPWAERAIIERLLEAAQRQLWERPDPGTLARLQELYGANDFWLEASAPKERAQPVAP